MGITYDFNIKDTEDALPVDAGIDGWDATIQINSVTTRRYAAQTPTSLISRLVDFRGSVENGQGAGTEGYALNASNTIISLLTADSASLTKDMMFVPTMVGLMIHPSSLGALSTDFTGCIIVRNTGVAPQVSRAITPAFSLAPSSVTLNASAVGGYTALEDAIPLSNTPTMSAVATAAPAAANPAVISISSVTAANDTFTTGSNHNLSVGTVVQFRTTGTLPAPLAANTNYFVQSAPSVTTFTVSATLGGGVVNITTAGSGTSVVNMNLNYAGYYYLCPVNKGWWQHSGGNSCGGTPLRGINLRNFGTSPFVPDLATATATSNFRYVTPVTVSNPYIEIALAYVAGTNTCRFAVVDLYGMMIPGTP